MTTTFDQAVPAQGRSTGLLDRERIVAKAGFNRWLVPPAALAIHLCIGMAYGLSACSGCRCRARSASRSPACAGHVVHRRAVHHQLRLAGRRMRLDVHLVLRRARRLRGALGRLAGARRAAQGRRGRGDLLVAAACRSAPSASIVHQLWLLWLGSGVIGGVGLGLGYISPVSTLIKWFPDRRGMATGMAIMGFGGGAMIGAPLAEMLMQLLRHRPRSAYGRPSLVLGVIYFVFMMVGAFGYRVPPAGWQPAGWTPPATPAQGDDHARAMCI